MNYIPLEIIIKIILILLVIIFITIILIKRFAYFQPKHKFLEIQENYKEIKIKHLYGWLLTNNNNKIIIYCPGNDFNISYRQEKIKMLHNMNYDVLIFDYSGFGNSYGIPNEQQIYDDVCLITAMTLQKYTKSQIIFYGEQIGCSVATYAARRYNINTLILESPLKNIKYIFNNKIFIFLGNFFTEFNTSSYLNGYQGRTLILYNNYDHNIDDLLLLCTDKIIFNNDNSLPYEEIKRFIDNTE